MLRRGHPVPVRFRKNKRHGWQFLVVLGGSQCFRGGSLVASWFLFGFKMFEVIGQVGKHLGKNENTLLK